MTSSYFICPTHITLLSSDTLPNWDEERMRRHSTYVSWSCIISLIPLLLPPITPSGTLTSLTSTPTFYNLRLWLTLMFKKLWYLNNSDVLRHFYDFRPMTTMKTMTHLLMSLELWLNSDFLTTLELWCFINSRVIKVTSFQLSHLVGYEGNSTILGTVATLFL